MKKIFSILLVLIMCTSLCACGGDSYAEVEKALQGTWSKAGSETVYTFENGTVICDAKIYGFEKTTAGTYEIGEHAIHIVYENGIEAVFEYTYENGELTLSFSDAWEGKS